MLYLVFDLDITAQVESMAFLHYAMSWSAMLNESAPGCNSKMCF